MSKKIKAGGILTSVLAENIRLGIFAGDQGQIAASLGTAFGVKDVIGVCAYNAAGQLLYRKTQQGWEDAPVCIEQDIPDSFAENAISPGVQYFEGGRNIVFWAEVKSRYAPFSAELLYFDPEETPSAAEKPYTVGFVSMVLSKAYLQEAVQEMLETGIILLTLFLGLISLATFFIIRELTKPLQQLSKSIKDYGVDVEGKDEVGLLADTFSSMITNLEKSFNTVNTLKTDLENKVKDLEQEIRSRKKAETALRESENKFRSISENISDGIALVQEGELVWLNNSFCEIFGFDNNSELVGRQAAELLHPAQQGVAGRSGESRMHLEAGKPFQTEVLDQNGNQIILDVKISQSSFSGKPAIELIIRDVTEKMVLEKEKIEMELKALSLSKLATIGEIATGIAHEINQPLTFVRIVYQSVLRDMNNGEFSEEEIRQKFNEALRQVERIAVITDHLRNFGRNNIAMISQVCLPGVFENALILMAERIRLRNMELIREIDDNLPEIRGNKMQLEQVFINLLQNSIDAMEEDRGGKIRVGMTRKGDFLEIVFSDTGPGIEPEIAENIFEPFFTTKEEEKGVGLGLAISSNILKEHRGTIEYCRLKDWGATFIITLPISGIS